MNAPINQLSYLFSRCLLCYFSINEVIEVGGETLVGQVGILSENVSTQIKILWGGGGEGDIVNIK